MPSLDSTRGARGRTQPLGTLRTYDFRAVVRTFCKITSDECTDGPLQLAARAVAGGFPKNLSALKQFVKRSEKLSQSTTPSTIACRFSPDEKGEDRLQQSCWPACGSLRNWNPPPPGCQTNALAAVDSHRQCHGTKCKRTGVCINNRHRLPGTGKDTLGLAPGLFLAVCAVVYRMRSSDSESVSWQGISTPRWIQFFDGKRG